MTGKWTIKRLNRHDGRPLPMPWHAIPPHTPIPPRDLSHHSMRVLYEDDDVGTGVTHGEVMGYVNEQIRAARKALVSKSPANMAPEEAQQWADMADDVPGYHDQPASRAYRTIASMTKEYRAVSKHPDSSLGIGPTVRSGWYPTRDEAIANRDPRVIETYSRLIGIEHRYATQPEDSDG